MKIIRTVPSENGAYSPPVECDCANIPAGYAIIQSDLDMTAFYANGGFITPAFADGVLTSYAANADAWNAWKASLPPEPEPAADPNADRDTMIVDHEYRLTLLELGVTK